jgi:hypothetical protein
MKNLFDIFEKLRLNKENGLFITANNKWQTECNFSSRIEKLIKEKIKPDAFFVFDNKPLILFYDSHENKEIIHKALWNFNECPIIFFVDNGNIEIYNGFRYLKEKSSLELFAGKESINDFNYFEIVSGKTWDKYQSWLKYDSRVDYHLLKNIKAARDILIFKNQLYPNVANALIGKVIFVRYLIDRNIKIGFEGEKHWSNIVFCSLLSNRNNAINFFKYLEQKFNGDMFKLDDSEYLHITQDALNTIISLLNEDDLGNGQQSLFKLYDFSIIPIEFISNVYESFIGESNQENEGAYYTPLFLVDYILNETVEKYHQNNKNEYTCKVLDPACGSGIFLVETLRKIIERYISLNPEIKEDSEEFKEVLRQLAIDNIFGIDKNLSAIQVAIFSIQLTLLDYQKPSSIETFKFPKLLNTNFFEADFFDTTHAYNEILKQKNLNFILGNPPWKGNGMDSLGKAYLKNRKTREKGKKYPIAVNNGETAEGFVLRVSDFTDSNTEISLIVRSSILYNLGYKTDRSAFRNYWTEEFYIDKVFELAPVRKEVFDKSNDPSVAPTAVLFYKYANGISTDNNIIEHITLKPSRFFSLFKVFSISRNDIKKVEQKKLKEFDWLWKVLVYGSYLDFNFINELKGKYKSINGLITDKSKFVTGTGIHMRGFDMENPMNSDHLIDKPLIKPSAIDSFHINYDDTEILNTKRIHRIRDSRLYEAPILLVKKGVDTTGLKTKSAISDRDVIFKDGLTSIKNIQGDKNILRKISALLLSEIYSYFAINTFVSIGIEREQAQNYNKFSTPFIDCEIENLVVNIEELKKQIFEEKRKFPTDVNIISKITGKINKNLAEIDNKVFKTLDLNKQEYSLINFALEVNRPIITKNQAQLKNLFQPFEMMNNDLEKYAELFLKRFSKSLSTETHKFIVEIWHSKQIVGMFFKVVPKSENQDGVVWIDKSKEDLLKIAIKLSSQKITDKLFVQKDLRGFEKDFFYIFKPNEKRLWHRAIGYQDVDEFMDAILKTGRRKYAGE